VSLSRLFAKPLLFISAIVTSACSAGPAFGPSVLALSAPNDGSVIPTVLAACPSSPNCVSSQATSEAKLVEAYVISTGDMPTYQAKLISVIEADGGVVREQRAGYVWASYTSRVFRFVDDIEWLYDAGKNVFHVRSASRTGHSDFGVNKKRVARIRTALAN